jgi:hypothetical protein
VKNVGEPCAGKPHARFDGRALETEQSWQPNTAALGKPRDLSPDVTYHCHRASARPYQSPRETWIFDTSPSANPLVTALLIRERARRTRGTSGGGWI